MEVEKNREKIESDTASLSFWGLWSLVFHQVEYSSLPNIVNYRFDDNVTLTALNLTT
jgi:hypothetical protein